MARDTKERVCRSCRRFVKTEKCPVCNQSSFSTSWKGVVFVNDPTDSEIAKALGLTAPGKYCLFVK